MPYQPVLRRLDTISEHCGDLHGKIRDLRPRTETGIAIKYERMEDAELKNHRRASHHRWLS